jgi:hypothetical protein
MELINDLMIGLAVGISFGLGGSYLLAARQAYIQNVMLKDEMLINFRETRQILLDRLVDETNISNAILLTIHNGGGKLIDGVPWYSSVVAEAPEYKKISVLNTWRNVPVDAAYKDLIRRVKERQAEYITTESMPIGELKTAYEAMGIVGSVVIEIFSGENGYHYLSCPVTANWDKFTLSPDQYAVTTTVNKLRKKYAHYSRYDVLKYDFKNKK